MRHVVSVTVSSILVLLLTSGCGTSGSNTTSATGKLVVAMGDAPSDRIIAFGLTVNNMTLVGGANPTVISSPTPLEFVRNAGTFQPLVLSNTR